MEYAPPPYDPVRTMIVVSTDLLSAATYKALLENKFDGVYAHVNIPGWVIPTGPHMQRAVPPDLALALQIADTSGARYVLVTTDEVHPDDPMARIMSPVKTRRAN